MRSCSVALALIWIAWTIPAQAQEADAVPHAMEWSEARDAGTLGLVELDGHLESQIYLNRPITWERAVETAPHYPEGFDAEDTAAPNRNMPAAGYSLAAEASRRFNAQDAAYRISFNLSHYGGMPESAGDINGDGIDDFINMSHFAYVDNMTYAGEVHVWLGRPEPIDTTTDVPDLVIYGDQPIAKLGISVAGAGDVNGDGYDDLLMSAAFFDEDTEDGRVLRDAGRVYLVYGGQFDFDGRPLEVRISDLGHSVAGVVFRGGFDGSAFLAWANGLESGDFNGDGYSDFIIGSYDPYAIGTVSVPAFPGRAYVIFGSAHDPISEPDYRLGIAAQNDRLPQSRIMLPDAEVTRASLGFGAAFVGDINNDGRDDIALSTGRYGEEKRGAAHVFLGREGGLPHDGTVPLSDADIYIFASGETETRPLGEGTISFIADRIQQARPVSDFNCDGLPDLLLGARYTRTLLEDGYTYTGGAAIFFGRQTWPDSLSILEADSWIVNDGETYIGHPAVDRHQDLNGDGCADILVNDPNYVEPVAGTLQYRGRLWVINGSPTPRPVYLVEQDASHVFVADNRYPGMFGYTWQTGDWNGDGRYDVVIGDHYHGTDDVIVHSGVTFMFYNGIDFIVD